MLNLKFIYEDAIYAIENYSEYLEVPSVAATVYMLQQDVINSYKHALNHYFTISLDESYLQDSSLGTPYQKWQYFTNENYAELSFSVDNLLRYTSRLLHESELKFYESESRYEERRNKSNRYTGPICIVGSHDRFIGVRIRDDEKLELSQVYGQAEEDPKIIYTMTSQVGGGSNYFRITKNVLGLKKKHEISKEEYLMEASPVKSTFYDLSGRSILQKLKVRGLKEVEFLEELFKKYGKACRNMKKGVFEPFTNINESWWI